MTNKPEGYSFADFLKMSGEEADAFQTATKFIAPFFGRLVGALYRGNKRIALPSEVYPNGFQPYADPTDDNDGSNYTI